MPRSKRRSTFAEADPAAAQRMPEPRDNTSRTGAPLGEASARDDGRAPDYDHGRLQNDQQTQHHRHQQHHHQTAKQLPTGPQHGPHSQHQHQPPPAPVEHTRQHTSVRNSNNPNNNQHPAGGPTAAATGGVPVPPRRRRLSENNGAGATEAPGGTSLLLRLKALAATDGSRFFVSPTFIATKHLTNPNPPPICLSCATVDAPPCPDGAACRLVHCDARGVTPASAHMNYAWHDLADVAYPRCAEGDSFDVAAPNTRIIVDRSLPSQCLLWTDALGSSARRPLTHCAHYYYNRRCDRGARCRFVHAVFLDPTARTLRLAPPPVELGRSQQTLLEASRREPDQPAATVVVPRANRDDSGPGGPGVDSSAAPPVAIPAKLMAAYPVAESSPRQPRFPDDSNAAGSRRHSFRRMWPSSDRAWPFSHEPYRAAPIPIVPESGGAPRHENRGDSRRARAAVPLL